MGVGVGGCPRLHDVLVGQVRGGRAEVRGPSSPVPDTGSPSVRNCANMHDGKNALRHLSQFQIPGSLLWGFGFRSGRRCTKTTLHQESAGRPKILEPAGIPRLPPTGAHSF